MGEIGLTLFALCAKSAAYLAYFFPNETFQRSRNIVWFLIAFVKFLCVLCPDRDYGDFLCALLFVVLIAAVLSLFLLSMGIDDRSSGDERLGWPLRAEKIFADAVAIDGRKEWICKFCSEISVWTRWRCRRCHTAKEA